MFKVIIKSTAVVSLLLSGGTAWAQTSQDSFFDRNRNTSVSERERPEYDAPGIRTGSFILNPELTLDSEFNDNIFATDLNQESDIVAIISPSLRIETLSSNHSLLIDLSLERLQYFDFEDESVTNLNGGIQSTLDVQRDTYFELGANYGLGHERRTQAVTANSSDVPIEFNNAVLSVGLFHERGRAKLQSGVTYDTFDYKDARLNDGTIEDQDFRDADVLGLFARGDYAISPDTALFVRGEYDDESYKRTQLVPFERNQKGYSIDVGADFDITNMMRGEVSLGYLNRNFENALSQDINDFRYAGRLEWFATPLITVTADAGRTVRPSGLLASPAFTENRINLALDYEWRRNIILSTGYVFSDEAYRGIDRDDRRISYYMGADYLMNRNVSFGLSINRDTLDSDGANNQFDFNVTRVLFSVSLRR